MIAPSKRLVSSRILDAPGKPSAFRIEFIPDEVGTHVIEVCSILICEIWYFESINDFFLLNSGINSW